MAFTPTSLGTSTSGVWSLEFDGSDVGLASSSSEDIDAVSVTSDGGIHFSTTGSFSVSGLAGTDEDVGRFDPTSLGSSTSGAFQSSLIFDGSAFGFTNDIGGLHIVDTGGAAASVVEVRGIGAVGNDTWNLVGIPAAGSSGEGEGSHASQMLLGWGGRDAGRLPVLVTRVNLPPETVAISHRLLELLSHRKGELESLDAIFADWECDGVLD